MITLVAPNPPTDRAAAPLLALRTPVLVFVIPAGAREVATVRAVIVARTREGRPRYDVRAGDGTLYRNLPASAIEPLPETPVTLVTQDGKPAEAA